MLKRFSKTFLSSLLAMLMIVSLFAIPASAASVSLSSTSFSLTKGYATTLKVNGTTSKATWSTGDKSIATVSSAGKVVGKKLGTTYIYAKVNGTTLKAKVSVVAGKITSSSSNVSMEAGDKKQITITAIGTHTISAGSTDKSVVKATWSGAKFSGNKINLTLTAVGNGTAKIKVYAKNYPSSVYKYITVTVGSGGEEIFIDDDNSGLGQTSSSITASVSSASLTPNGTSTFNVTTSSSSKIGVTSSNSNIASAYAIASNNYTSITVTGIAQGSTTLKVYLRDDTSKYISIPVYVSGTTAGYYSLVSTAPVKSLATDNVIRIDTTQGTRYMLVPYGYDVAMVNTEVAKTLNLYKYYQLYTSTPVKLASTDTINTVTTKFANKSVARYMIVPATVDQAQIDTVLAQYTSTYEYYKVYTASPTKRTSSDEIMTWTKEVYSGTNKTLVTRYMLVSYGQSTSQQANLAKAADLSTNTSNASYYTVFDTYPTSINNNTDILFSWYNKTQAKTKYMITPKTNCDFVARNDAVLADTGVYCYYNAYSTKPTITNSGKDSYTTMQLVMPGKETSQLVYILIKKADAQTITYVNRMNDIQNGVYCNVEQSWF